ncbi:MAG: hypothetical protein O3A25_13585, partial [Acidobacteria bacterium]|nr:hypothetical protein [Acidobacteriota bacterium]
LKFTPRLDAIQLPLEIPATPPAGSQAQHRDNSTRGLYRFFVEQCDLAQNEAEVRVAKIGNDFWDWKLQFDAGGDGVKKGCDAIRKHLARHQPQTDT